MALVIGNTNNGGSVDLLNVPLRPDGMPFRFEVVFKQFRAYADTADGVLDALIPGYALLSDEPKRYEARIKYAVETQKDIQQWINTEHDLDDLCSRWERAILEASRDTPPTITDWECAVPLVLVDVFYAPEGDLPRPSGEGDVANPRNLVWLTPADPYDFLESLAAAGAVSLHETIEAVA